MNDNQSNRLAEPTTITDETPVSVAGGNSDEARRNPLSLKLCPGGVYLLVIGGLFLFFWKPIWLLPPNFGLTYNVYMVLLLAWIPALIACAWLRRGRGFFPSLFGALVISVIVFIVGASLTGDSVVSDIVMISVLSQCAEPLTVPGPPSYSCRDVLFIYECTQKTQRDGSTLLTCTAVYGLGEVGSRQWVRWQNWPVMWRVHRQTALDH